ncbi:MAG: preprotein translocase subunit SecY [Deltaproteobacteria bacterium]|nr:preprotein translocase subunit SecY [Deltaproteobacteria bacterium]
MAEGGIGGLTKIPELRKRVLFTILMLGIYRLGVFVPTPGINVDALKRIFSQGTVFEIFNLFSGGALEQFSVFALGIMPYISASIILQLLTVSVPTLEKLSKEGDYGRKKITQYTRYGTVVLSLIQGFGISYGLEQQQVLLPGVGGFGFYLTTMLTLSCGTAFIMWLGEQISERGIGNGISLIIFAGIVTNIPGGLRDAWSTKEQFAGFIGFLLLLAFIFAVIMVIIFFERSQRRIPIQYAKRIIGRKLYGGQSTHLPLKLNMSGVIPPIFASSIILFPATVAQFWKNDFMQSMAGALTTGWFHDTLYVGMIVFFCYFYTAVTFNPLDVSENLKKNGGYIPGIRPGKPTSDFIDRILSRITLGGAIYISAVCILPTLLIRQFGIPVSLASVFGGTSLLIVVGVAMDTVAQMESHLLTRSYEGFLGGRAGKFRGRRA